jgi:hypothetical protein
VCPPHPPGKRPAGSGGHAPNTHPVKAMFWLYFVMIWAGIVYFSVIGLTHH